MKLNSGTRVKYPIFLSNINHIWILSNINQICIFPTVFHKSLQNKISLKYVQWKPSGQNAGQTDMTKLKGAFHNLRESDWK
jgi:hypothetical protein